MKTRTAAVPIGVRRTNLEAWQRNIHDLIDWLNSVEINVVDLGPDGDKIAEVVSLAGLQVGSADLPDPEGLLPACVGLVFVGRRRWVSAPDALRELGDFAGRAA